MFPLRIAQPSNSRPVVTIGLIVVNLLVFVWETAAGPVSKYAWIEQYGLVPDRLRAIQILTAMFLHAGWLHLLGDMSYLWLFGEHLEGLLGRRKFLFFYLVCGVVASFAAILCSPFSAIPMVGAGGAINGIMGAYLMKFPRSRVLTLVPLEPFLVKIPASILLGGWLLIQLAGILGIVPSESGMAAFAPPFLEFVAGAVLVDLLTGRNRLSRRDQR